VEIIIFSKSTIIILFPIIIIIFPIIIFITAVALFFIYFIWQTIQTELSVNFSSNPDAVKHNSNR
jgi:hypothetical protein